MEGLIVGGASGDSNPTKDLFINVFESLNEATEVELKNIQGSGVIEACILNENIDSNLFHLELEIDGTRYFRISRDYVSSGTARNEAAGFCTRQYYSVATNKIKVNSSPDLAVYGWFPFTVGDEFIQTTYTPKVILAGEPIVFKKSCIVKFLGQIGRTVEIVGWVDRV